MELNVKVTSTIFKPIEEVFDGIVNPNKISKYFTSASSGELKEGENIIWTFGDVGVALEIQVLELEKYHFISFKWGASGKMATVEIKLNTTDENHTDIEITESPYEMNEDDIQKVLQQTQGWTDFICSLKAYLYTGINLRNGKMMNLS